MLCSSDCLYTEWRLEFYYSTCFPLGSTCVFISSHHEFVPPERSSAVPYLSRDYYLSIDFPR